MRLVSNSNPKKRDYELALDRALKLFGRDLPPPQREARLIPGRRFAWDFAWIEQHIAVEVQGGIFLPGRSGHSSGVGIQRDHRKANLAAIRGFRTLFFGPNDLTTWNQGEASVRIIRAAICGVSEFEGLPLLEDLEASGT